MITDITNKLKQNIHEKYEQLSDNTRQRLSTLGCATALLATLSIGLGTCYGIKAGCNAIMPEQKHIKKEMYVGRYKVTAIDYLGKRIEIEHPDIYAMLKADAHSDTSKYPRFDEIALWRYVPKGDSLEEFMNLRKLQALYDSTMRYGKDVE